ncbi:ABC transporter ATP-binding protein [Listeria booriae]|uniref:ABC transporter ATP-binding protein n=1 Tax=Listeria booriae TaxID=1552123 RepID=A0A7X1CCS5_9LIST|nr:ABC transporter ATP-binding protein [Listeria booriae]MBC1492766.1 ABC transporter ATP-binding protein [Listeria booriae]
MNIIEIRNLTKIKKDKKILDNISFDVKSGEILAILGHNGAGKTTLINSIMRLTRYDGTINFSFQIGNLYKKIAYQMQSTSFENEAKVFEICKLYKKLLKTHVDIEDLLKKFNMQDSKNLFIKDLSGGQRQILAILLTLIGEPEVVIFDELTTGLDSLNRRRIWEILKNLNQERKITIILTSHFLEEVEYLANRVVILKHGEIEKIGYVNDIINEQFSDMKKIQFETKNLDQAKNLFGDHIKISGQVVSFVYKEDEEIEIFRKVQEIKGENIVMKRFSFEDAFLQMLGYQIAEEGEIVHE